MFKLLLLTFFSFIYISKGKLSGYLSINENINVTLHCNISLKEYFEYPEWKSPNNERITSLGSKNLNNDLDIVKEKRLFYSDNNKDLIITNIKYNDGGVYMCIYNKKNDYYYFSVSVNVKVNDTIDVLTKLKSDVFLPCNFNKDKLKLDWVKGKKLIISTKKRFVNKLKKSKVNRISYHDNGIIIKNVKKSDEGKYTCKYYNRHFYVNLIIDKN